MISAIFLTIILFVGPQSTNSTWTSVTNPAPNIDYVSGTWTNALTCYMVGNSANNGAVITSTDGGNTWATSLTNVGRLFDIASKTIGGTTYIFAVSYSGVAYYTTTAGATWTPVTVSSGSLLGVSIGSNGKIFAVGYNPTFPTASLIYNSSVTTPTLWSTQNVPSNVVSELRAITTVDGVNAIIAGSGGTVLKTTTGGLVWTQVNSGTTSNLYDISAISSTNAIAVGDSATVLTTTNGGLSWTVASVAGVGNTTSSTVFQYHPVTMITAQDAYLASTTGEVLISNNGGNSWSVSTGKLGYPLYSCAAFNANTVVIGSARSKNGQSTVFVKSTDSDFTPFPSAIPTLYPSGFNEESSVTWTKSYLGSGQYFIRSSAWSSQTNVVLVGEYLTSQGIILLSTTGGKTAWIATKVPNTYNSVVFHAYSVLQTYFLTVSQSGSILLSSDNGQTWSLSGQLQASLYGVTMGKNGNAYVAGVANGKAAVYYSTLHDSTPFTNWVAISPSINVPVQLNAIKTFDGRRIIAIGLNGTIITSSNSGVTWSLRASGTTLDLYSISSVSSTVAMVAGKSNIVLRTTNAGLNWAVISFSPGLVGPTNSFYYNSISMASSPVIYLAGTNGAILVTQTGGHNWVNETTIAIQDGDSLQSITMFGTGYGIATGTQGFAYVKSWLPPTTQPTGQPSSRPSGQPIWIPTSQPSLIPSSSPTKKYAPSSHPTSQPASHPTSQPSSQPSSNPTYTPTSYVDVILNVPVSQSFTGILPTANITGNPTNNLNFERTIAGFIDANSKFVEVKTTSQSKYFTTTTQPTWQPTFLSQRNITRKPSYRPSSQPSSQPTSRPSTQPSSHPSSQPSFYPSSQPSGRPSSQPTQQLRRRLSSEEQVVDTSADHNINNASAPVTDHTYFVSGLQVLSISTPEIQVHILSASSNSPSAARSASPTAKVAASIPTSPPIGTPSGITVNYIVRVRVQQAFDNITNAHNQVSANLNYVVQSTICTQAMRASFAGTSLQYIACEPFVIVSPLSQCSLDSIHNTLAPNRNDDEIGNLQKNSFIILICFMTFLFCCLLGVIVFLCLRGNNGRPVDCMKACGACAVCCICLRRRNRHDEDEDEEEEEASNKNPRMTKRSSVATAKSPVRGRPVNNPDDEDDEDDDEDEKPKKQSFFSRVMSRGKVKKHEDDDEDDDDE